MLKKFVYTLLFLFPGSVLANQPKDWQLGFQKSASQGMEDIVCLLYTSPSPRDRTRSRMPSSA